MLRLSGDRCLDLGKTEPLTSDILPTIIGLCVICNVFSINAALNQNSSNRVASMKEPVTANRSELQAIRSWGNKRE